jgi:hypothetical protein
MTHLLQDEKLENPSNYDNHDHQHQQRGQVSNTTKSVGKERRKSIPKLEQPDYFLKNRGEISWKRSGNTRKGSTKTAILLRTTSSSFNSYHF